MSPNARHYVKSTAGMVATLAISAGLLSLPFFIGPGPFVVLIALLGLAPGSYLGHTQNRQRQHATSETASEGPDS